MKLFEDKIRDSYQSASHGENIYDYFDNNEQVKIKEIRELLNTWFENYPEENRLDLQYNFKNNFYDAFYELFIHETFYSQGYKLIPHPLLEQSTKRPDFLAKKGKEEFYIEATTVSIMSDLEKKKANFEEKFIEEINKLNSPNFWLGLKKLIFKKNSFPKVGTLRMNIEKELNKITPLSFLFPEKHNPELKFEDDNLSIIIEIFPKSESMKRVKDSRPIGIISYPVTIKDATEEPDKILKNLKDKSKRYGELNKPFIICLNLDFQFNLKYDVDWAFYNQNSFNSTTPKFTKVSMALITQVTLGNIFNDPKHRLIINPHSKFPMKMENIELSFENQQMKIHKKNLEQLLKLN